eukprot:scaffold141686_cov18-Tisochrysis_lutea.AAC.2
MTFACHSKSISLGDCYLYSFLFPIFILFSVVSSKNGAWKKQDTFFAAAPAQIYWLAMLNDDGDRFPFFFLNLFVALMAAESAMVAIAAIIPHYVSDALPP